MKNSRDEQFPASALWSLTQRQLREALKYMQRDDIEEACDDGEPVVPNGRTLRTSIERVSRRLETRADSLNKKRCPNEHSRWRMRGRQEVLREVAGHLHDLCAKQYTFYTLYLALKDCLGCLEKYEVDVEEGKCAPDGNARWPIERWKAEGATRELPVVFAALVQLLYKHMPLREQHILSFDGITLVPLQSEDTREEETRDNHEAWLASIEANRPDNLMTIHSAAQRHGLGEEDLSPPLAIAPTASIGPFNQMLASMVSPLWRAKIPPSLLLGPFPPFPEDLNEYQQTCLSRLEDALSQHTHILLETSGGYLRENVELLWTFVDRLLQYTAIERILVLAATPPLKQQLRWTYKEWISLEDGERPLEGHAVQYRLTVPLASETRVCIASVREGQLAIPTLQDAGEPPVPSSHSVLTPDTFDTIIIYGAPPPSILWQRVLAYFTPSQLICFSPMLNEHLIAWVGGRVIRKTDLTLSFDRDRGDGRRKGGDTNPGGSDVPP